MTFLVEVVDTDERNGTKSVISANSLAYGKGRYRFKHKDDKELQKGAMFFSF